MVLAPRLDRRAPQLTWQCLKSNLHDTGAWEGTTITFTLHPLPGATRIELCHSGYPPSPCLDVSARGWAFFVGTILKRFIETGIGIPGSKPPITKPAPAPGT